VATLQTAAFLVDLAAEKDDVGFGLEVIRQIASILKPRGSVNDFLRDGNFFVIVVTVHGLSPKDLTTAWGALAEGISINRVADNNDVKATLQTKTAGELNVPVVYKPDKERLIPPLVNGWR